MMPSIIVLKSKFGQSVNISLQYKLQILYSIYALGVIQQWEEMFDL